MRAVATALRFQQMLQGLDIVPATPTTPFTFRDLAGNQFTLDVGISNDPLLTAPDSAQGPLPEYMQNTSQHYWFTYSSGRRLIYFKYNSCNDDPAYPFASMAANLLSTLDTNPVDTLVIDLRGNFGGVIKLISPLVDGLVARMGTLVQNPDFRIYVFIDKVTFSAASYDAEYFKAPASEYGPAVPPGFDPSKIVIVMGEPTSEAPGVSDTTSFTLPYSKLDGEYSSAYIPGLPFVTPDYDPAGSSVGPDIAVPLNSTDYFARHDPMLAAALARFPGAPPAPTGSAIAVNGASFRVEQGLAPGSLASVFGTFPAGVDGVLVNGEAGQRLAASTSQVNFVMPASASLGRATISVRSGGSEVANGQATITPTGPGIFVLQPSDPSQSGAVLNQDSSVNASTTLPRPVPFCRSSRLVMARSMTRNKRPSRCFWGNNRPTCSTARLLPNSRPLADQCPGSQRPHGAGLAVPQRGKYRKQWGDGVGTLRRAATSPSGPSATRTKLRSVLPPR